MPEYIYEHPDTGKQITVWQSIHEEHIYEVDGVVHNRVYTIPQASIDTKIDPYSSKDFREKVKAQNVGDIWDRSKELSEIRKDKDGRDPVQENTSKITQKKEKGKSTPKIPQKLE